MHGLDVCRYQGSSVLDSALFDRGSQLNVLMSASPRHTPHRSIPPAQHVCQIDGVAGSFGHEVASRALCHEAVELHIDLAELDWIVRSTCSQSLLGESTYLFLLIR